MGSYVVRVGCEMRIIIDFVNTRIPVWMIFFLSLCVLLIWLLGVLATFVSVMNEFDLEILNSLINEAIDRFNCRSLPTLTAAIHFDRSY